METYDTSILAHLNGTRYLLARSKILRSKEAQTFVEYLLGGTSKSEKKIAGARRPFAFIANNIFFRNRQASDTAMLANIQAGDVVVFAAADLDSLEKLFFLLPELDLSQPISASAHFRLELNKDASLADLAQIITKLKSGSPFQKIYLYADTERQAEQIGRATGIEVYSLDQLLTPESSRDTWLHQITRLRPSIEIEQFGPVVTIISALWGRVGSSTIFDAQTRYFIDRGYIVARVLLDHHPQSKFSQPERIDTFLSEDFEKITPHFWAVCDRDTSSAHSSRVAADPLFKNGSPLIRTVLLLEQPIFRDLDIADWLRKCSSLTVVNHLMHVALAEKLSRQPIILETHDIFSHLLSSHGIPYFVPVDKDSEFMRLAEETQIWKRVAACVNLSPNDHAIISPHVEKSAYIRPYIEQRPQSTRSWEEIAIANNLPNEVRSVEKFDIVLWGTWHQGNIDGIHWFLKSVRPIHQTLMDAKILIVGRVINGLERSDIAESNVYCVGYVDRIEDFLRCATVAVIPDRSSTGISIKMMDVSSLGLAFVSTDAGLRTLNFDKAKITPHSSEKTFADDVVMMLKSPSARNARAAAAREIYEDNFSKRAYENNWDQLIKKISTGQNANVTSIDVD